MKTAVYRMFDEHRRLLYVGMTNNPERRFGEHVEGKEWFRNGECVDIEVEWFENRFLAEDAEMVAIWEENPRYNIDRRLPRSSDPRGRAADTVSLYDCINGYLGQFA